MSDTLFNLPLEQLKNRLSHSRKVWCLEIPANFTGHFLNKKSVLKKHLLRLPRIRSVVDVPGESSRKYVRFCSATYPVQSDSPPRGLVQKIEQEIGQELLPHQFRWLAHHQINLGYDYMSYSEVLRKILPAKVNVPNSFETVGHLIHLNLKPPQLPYKFCIANVMLDKLSPRIRTIVNKTNSLEDNNVFRISPVELLAGERDYEVTLKEHNTVFQFNYEKVYWNSRLQTEHHRLVASFQAGEVICDAMAGVGPFAIPSAKKGHRVYANDLNPVSYKYLLENARKNHVSHLIHCSQVCARTFIQKILTEGVIFHHLIMNLPARSFSFLDVLKNGFPASTWASQRMPLVHCYCFSKASRDTWRNEVTLRIEEALDTPLDDWPIDIRHIRTVGPNTEMLCALFQLPKRIGLADS